MSVTILSDKSDNIMILALGEYKVLQKVLLDLNGQLLLKKRKKHDEETTKHSR